MWQLCALSALSTYTVPLSVTNDLQFLLSLLIISRKRLPIRSKHILLFGIVLTPPLIFWHPASLARSLSSLERIILGICTRFASHNHVPQSWKLCSVQTNTIQAEGYLGRPSVWMKKDLRPFSSRQLFECTFSKSSGVQAAEYVRFKPKGSLQHSSHAELRSANLYGLRKECMFEVMHNTHVASAGLLHVGVLG